MTALRVRAHTDVIELLSIMSRKPRRAWIQTHSLFAVPILNMAASPVMLSVAHIRTRLHVAAGSHGTRDASCVVAAPISTRGWNT